jgi:flagellar protein FlgJ
LTARTSPSNRQPIVDRSKVDPRIRQAAEGMEAMFLDYLMKTMRETVPKNDLDLENAGSKIYRGMLDSEIAQQAARQGGIGLAEPIIAYLESQGYTKQADPSASTGGTSHASQPPRK